MSERRNVDELLCDLVRALGFPDKCITKISLSADAHSWPEITISYYVNPVDMDAATQLVEKSQSFELREKV